ncbi:glycosyltransferase [Christiangramia sp. LLG6405-1]|uniref:glycosyltransferase n=1 Tax=Christiangramia sp. LLG6405-1 TaxID=3160832 RepID=UPI003868D258
MKVLQVIDTLEAGGAEKVAVSYANSLVGKIEASYLCCTRKEGILKAQILDEVRYTFLNKRSFYDTKAYARLYRFIRDNSVDTVHAHGTSYFMLSILKIFYGLDFQLYWHDHYGNSDHLQSRNKQILKVLSHQFSGIICVNPNLLQWASKELNCNNIIYLPNFPEVPQTNTDTVNLLGDEHAIKIICVANLRKQKDHLNLLRAFEQLPENYSLHLFGHHFGDSYSSLLLESFKSSKKNASIFYYGSIPDISSYIEKADIGVLASRSEGLPLALLEYGFAGLKVVCTDVGNCKEVVGAYGIIVPAEDSKALADGIKNSLSLNSGHTISLKKRIDAKYSVDSIIPQLLKFYKSRA